MSFRLSRKSNKDNTIGRSWLRSRPKNDVSAAASADCAPPSGAGNVVLPGQANDTQHSPTSKDPVNPAESIQLMSIASVVNSEGMAEGSHPATPTDRSPVKGPSPGARTSYDASGEGCVLASSERPLKRQSVSSLGNSLRSRASFLHISPRKSIVRAFRGLSRSRTSNITDAATFEPPGTCTPDCRQDTTPRTIDPFPGVHPNPSSVSSGAVPLPSIPTPSIPTPSQAQQNAGAWYAQCSPDGVGQKLKEDESRKMTLGASPSSSEKQRLSAIAGAEETRPGQNGAEMQEDTLNKISQITLTAVTGLPNGNVAEDDATGKLEFSDGKVEESSLSSSDETPQPTPRPSRLKKTVALIQETSGFEEKPTTASSSLDVLDRCPSLSRSINLRRGLGELSVSKVENTPLAAPSTMPVEGRRIPSHGYEADQEDNNSSDKKSAVAKVPSPKKSRFRKRSMIAWTLEPPPPNEILGRGPLTGYQAIIGLDPSPEGTALLRTSSPEGPSLESPSSSIENSTIQQPTTAFHVTLLNQSRHEVFDDSMKHVKGKFLMKEFGSVPVSSTSATTTTTEGPNPNDRLWSKLRSARLKEMESSGSLRRRYMASDLTPPQTPHDSSDNDSVVSYVFPDHLNAASNVKLAGDGITNMAMTTATGMVDGGSNGNGTAQHLSIGGSLESPYAGAPDSHPTRIDTRNVPARLSSRGEDISIEKSRVGTDIEILPSISDLPVSLGGDLQQQQQQQQQQHQLDGENYGRSVDGDPNAKQGIYVNIDELEQFLIGGPLNPALENPSMTTSTTTITTTTTTTATAAAISSSVDIDSHAGGGRSRVGDDSKDVNDDDDDDDDDDQSTTDSRRPRRHSSSVGVDVWSPTGSGYETDDESLVDPDE